jgi:hypothetical protein
LPLPRPDAVGSLVQRHPGSFVGYSGIKVPVTWRRASRRFSFHPATKTCRWGPRLRENRIQLVHPGYTYSGSDLGWLRYNGPDQWPIPQYPSP